MKRLFSMCLVLMLLTCGLAACGQDSGGKGVTVINNGDYTKTKTTGVTEK